MKKSILTIVLLIVALFTANTVNAQAPVATPEEAITGLLNRIGGNGAADKFEIVIDASLAENGKDVFVITSQNGKPCIKGNTQLSVATGINWYLNHYAHINLTWNNLTTDLSKVELPVPSSEEKHVSSAAYRYDFNTCTFSYSMAFWTWERWQQEIDWMALHGINAPLNLVGLDVVTRKFLRELGVSESDINAYIAGPGFIAWFAMNNLEGWGGTIESQGTGVFMQGNPDWWYTRQENLCRNMLQRMRELGMQPVIPGFSGQVPNCIVNYSINGFSSGDVVNNGTWAGGYTRPDILKPNTTSYQTFATVYYKHLHEVMGVSELYSIDPFHEGSLPSGVSNKTCYPNIMVELDKHFGNVEQSVKDSYKVTKSPSWIIQYWQGVPQSGAFTAMKDAGYTNRFIGLDLFADNIYADNAAKWRTNYYDTCPYIYCMLHNFGGRSGLHGRLETTMDGYFQALAKNNNCQGIGATPEGTETNPILYDMLFELPWMSSNPGADAWLAEYAHSRYGVDSKTAPAALEALKNLKKSVWDCRVNQQGTSEAVILARPNWTIGSVSSWSTSAIYWDTQDVLLAADQLYSVKDLVTANGGQDGIANYNYDFIDVVRQAMVDYAAQLLPLINAARGNVSEYTRLYKLYLQLMLDLDTMLSYDENFKLERWTSLARNIADEVSGTTENDRNWLEWNARTQVTVWSKGNTDLHDYSNRCWAGLIKDFHYWRWKYFFENNGNAPSGGWFSGFEYPWTVDFNGTYNYAGDYSKVVIPKDMTATEKAAQTFGNYFGRVKGATKNYIFPMGVATNATKSDVISEVYRGQEVELPLIIGKNVTISSVWIDLNADGNAGNGETLTANGNSVTIPGDAAIGKTTAKVTYSDGTEITFNLALIEDITSARTVTAVADANGSVAIEGTSELSISTTEAVKITATANTGYNFENWTKDGEVVSNDNPFIYYGKDAATFTANFIQNKWGVVDCGDDVDGQGKVKDEAAVMNDISNNKQYIPELTLAYYNREAETIFETTTAPTEIFNTIPQIINVPQGASFDVEYKGVDNFKHCYFRAYIDLNADGDFDDEGELLKEVGTKGEQNTAVCSNKVNVLLPYDMPLGITHMRMRFDSAWNLGEDAKSPSVRPVYEIIINVTEKSDKAATINVETNNAEWGTVEVWTDETPDGSTGTEWVVSANIPMYLRATKTSEDVEFLGWYDHYGRLLTTELEYSMLAREDATYTARFRKFLEIDGWQIEYRTESRAAVARAVSSDVVVLTKILQSGNHDLVIPETVEILGENLKIVGFDDNLFNNNKDLWSIELPKSIEFLSNKSLFNHTLTGNGQTQTFDVDIKNNEAWTVTMEVERIGTLTGWGSCLLASGNNPAKPDGSNYAEGFQFYLQCTEKGADRDKLIIKTKNQTGDNWYFDDVYQEESFTVIIEYNGAQQMSVNVLKADGANATNYNGKAEPIVFTNCTIQDIAQLCTNVQSAITANVEITKSAELDPFSGCTNLDKITIDEDCDAYYVNDGNLYNTSDLLVTEPDGKEKGADRRALATLIDEMEALTAVVGTYNPTGKNTEITLTTEQDATYYIWCSNPHPNGNDGAGGVAALLDENDDSYLHTNYTNVSSSNDFLQVELGEGNELKQFKIAGKQRKGAEADFPKTIEVQGSTDKNNWERITTVGDLTQTAGAAWESDVITTENNYPYLRFVVTTGTNRKFFHMAKFDLYKISASADVFSYLEGGISDAQAATAYDALLDAKSIFDNGTTATEMQTATAALQNAYDTLKGLLEAAIPVKLTLNEENPVLYKVIIKRANDGSKVLRYDNNDRMVAVVGNTDNKTWQAWYFMGSTNGVTIHPFNADGKVLSADNTSNAPAKVWAVEKGEKAFYEWKFVSRANGYYNIQAYDGSNYFSNNGGESNKMGFWSKEADSDGGSLFKFIAATFTNDNARYYQLSDVKETLPNGTNIYGGTSVGLYTTESVNNYREAYNTATELVNAGSSNSDSDDCYAAYKALRAANANLEYNAADPAKIYYIVSAATNNDCGYCKGKYVHTLKSANSGYNHKHLKFSAYNDILDKALAMFQFEETGTQGKYKMKNLHTGLYMNSYNKYAEHMKEENDAAIIKIAGYADGQITLKIGDSRPMHAQDANKVIVDWDAAEGNASLWTINEVNKEDVKHTVNITSAGYSTLYLNYPVEIPVGVKAYTANAIKDGYFSMNEITGVIPARTAVIIEGEEGSYDFVYSTKGGESVSTISKNGFEFSGTLWDDYVGSDDGSTYYVLSKVKEAVGMYRTQMKYNAQGVVPGEGDEPTHFKNNANKIYLKIYPTYEISLLSFYEFDFDGEGTTDINDVTVENEEVKAIYDLQGRRIKEITKPGLYIINGCKVLVK